jgi:UDP-glucose 4-epimerase
MPHDRSFWSQKRVLVTGGLGFVGSSLSLALVEAGAELLVWDALVPGYGGNLFHWEALRGRASLHTGDLRDEFALARYLPGLDFVFHCAGQVSHLAGMREPFADIDLNLRATATLLEGVKRHCPQAVLVYTGTRGQYGAALSLPVSEEAPCRPIAPHEITKQAAEALCLFYARSFGLRVVPCRLTNLYGPRSQMRSAAFGVVNWMLRLALDGKPLHVYGDGQVLRDFLYIDDAVEAMLALAATPEAHNRPLNIGSGEPCSLLSLARAIVEAAGCGSYELVPYSAERKAQEPGDFYCDISQLKAAIDWEPRVSLSAGLARSVAYYREHRACYWEP